MAKGASRCARHTAAIYDRGGKQRITDVIDMSAVTWHRVRDDVSDAWVTIKSPSVKCISAMEKVEPNRSELVIFRDGDRVWEGPVTLIGPPGQNPDGIKISARDVLHYAYRTAMHVEYDNSADWDGVDFVNRIAPVVDRAFNVLTAELTRVKEGLDPPINVVPYITKIRADDIADEARTARHTLPKTLTVYDDLDEMARVGGLDYTAVGRRIILNDTRVPVGHTPKVSESDFLGRTVISKYGMDSFTRAFTTGANGMIGEAGGVDPYYGEWENVESMYDADSVEEPTQESLDRAAEYNMFNRLPVPTVVRLPDNTRVNPNGVLTVDMLVPGVRIPLSANLAGGRKITQTQKLNTVKVSDGENGEEIKVSMTTAPGSELVVPS